MKKIFALAVLSTAMFGTSAFAAETATQDIDINAVVAPECITGAIPAFSLGNIPISTTADANGLTINGDIARGTHEQSAYMGCNYPMNINVTTFGLVSASNAALDGVNGFTNKLTYSWGILDFAGGANITGANNASGARDGRGGNRNPYYGQTTVSIWMTQAQNAGRRPLAGNDYHDVLTLTFSPQ